MGGMFASKITKKSEAGVGAGAGAGEVRCC